MLYSNPTALADVRVQINVVDLQWPDRIQPALVCLFSQNLGVIVHLSSLELFNVGSVPSLFNMALLERKFRKVKARDTLIFYTFKALYRRRIVLVESSTKVQLTQY